MAEEILESSSTQGGVEQARTADPNLDNDPIDITDKQAEKVIGNLVDSLSQYSDARSEWETHWRESADIYEGRDGENSQWPYASRYEIPEAFRQTEGMKALITNAFFSNKTWFEYEARHHGAEEESNIAAHIVRWQIKHFDIEDEIMTWPGEVVHYGVSYLLYGWSRFKRLKFKFSQEYNSDFDKNWQRETIEELHGAPYCEYISPWRMYMHPNVDRVDQSPLAFIIDHVSGDYLLTQARNGFYDMKSVVAALQERNAMPKDLPPEVYKNDNYELLGNPEFELMQCWTNGGKMYSIINRKTLVQSQMNPYGRINILNLRNYQSPGNAYGISEPKQLQPEQALIRDLSSMGVDSIFYKLQPMWLYKPELQRYFGDEDFSFKPGMCLPAEDTANAIRPVPTTAESGQIFQHAERIRQYAQMKTSYTDIVAGSGSMGVDTAYQHGKLQDASTQRLQARILMWEPRVRRLYEELHSLNAQFLDERVAVRVEGVNGGAAFGRYKDGNVAYSQEPLNRDEVVPGFGPESFSSEIDVEVSLPRTMGSPMERQQRLMAFWQMAAPDPRWSHEIIQEELARAFEFKSPKRLIAMPQRSQKDSAKENADFFAYGYIPDPLASEDHRVHMELHSYVPRMPEFAQLPQQVQAQFMQHMQMHAAFLGAMQNMAGASAQQGIAQPTNDGTSQDVRSASSDMAAETSQPQVSGALQQGMMPQ